MRRRPSLADILAEVERVKGKRWERFSEGYGDWGRDMALCLAFDHCGMTLKELGRFVGGLDYVSVCGATRRFRKRQERDPTLATLFAEANARLKIEKI
ncbi:MAG: hypothetical protein WBN92_09485 [Terriglobia bacterium]